MLSIYFAGLENRLVFGMNEFSKEYCFEISENQKKCDLIISLCKTENKKLTIERSGKNVSVSYNTAAHIFRAVSLILQNIEDETYKSDETVYFDDTIVMIDVSQSGALLKIEQISRMIRIIASMGFNAFMVYMEDCYEIVDVPRFGYMRPKYKYEDLKAIDDYAYSFGIEAIPCMQTLGHLSNLLKWHCFDKIKDGDSTLLVGEEKTYAFIRKMLEAATKPFRTKRIHIGMDEAWGLGLGKYLTINGYKNKKDILRAHLKETTKIAEDMCLKPMMWGDMFFRAMSQDDLYYTEKDIEFTEDVIQSIPKNMEIVYWDYSSEEPRLKNMIKQNKKLGRNIIYAGAVRNSFSFACRHTMNTVMANRALSLCKEYNIKKVMATVWGDNCPESFAFGSLLGLQLYAEHCFAKNVDKEKWYSRFKFCAKCDAEPFEMLELFDKIPGFTEENTMQLFNASKDLLWQDPLLGLFDKNIDSNHDLKEHYKNLGDNLTKYAEKNESFSKLLNFYATAAYALSEKATIGIILHNAYFSGDKNNIIEAKKQLQSAMEKIDKLHVAHKEMWFSMCNPVGWEILDIRYGALIIRMKTAIERLEDYISEKIDRIAELEENQFTYYGVFGWPCEYEYTRIISASKL